MLIAILQDMDHHIYHGRRTIKNIQSSYKKVKLKDFKIEELKIRSQPLAS